MRKGGRGERGRERGREGEREGEEGVSALLFVEKEEVWSGFFGGGVVVWGVEYGFRKKG